MGQPFTEFLVPTVGTNSLVGGCRRLSRSSLGQRSAYDNIITISQITESLRAAGAPVVLRNFLKAYMTNSGALITVSAGEVYFAKKKGCPQGSSLSPILFNICLQGLIWALGS